MYLWRLVGLLHQVVGGHGYLDALPELQVDLLHCPLLVHALTQKMRQVVQALGRAGLGDGVSVVGEAQNVREEPETG